MMNDSNSSIEQLKVLVDQFVTERDWRQFHSPKNLSMNLVREATELMELFLWVDNKESLETVEKRKQEVVDELADVVIGLFAFANVTSIDVANAVEQKLEKAKQKYPVALCKGKSDKYTVYQSLKKNYTE